MKACISALGAMMALALLATPAAAQSDLSGVWMRAEPGNTFSEEAPQLTPWAETRFRANRPTVGPRAALDANDPTLSCALPGVPYVLAVPTPFEFVHARGEVIQLFEYNHVVRRIYTDGRSHPADVSETGSHEWMGHSIGRWERDTFVIETVGFNDTTWLDRVGHPHSTSLRLIERIRRVDGDTLEYIVTVDDPVAYHAPWTGRMTFLRRVDWALLEHTCIAADDTYLRFKSEAWGDTNLQPLASEP